MLKKTMPTEKRSSLRFCFKVWSPGASFIRSMGLGLLVRFFFFSCQRKKTERRLFCGEFSLVGKSSKPWTALLAKFAKRFPSTLAFLRWYTVGFFRFEFGKFNWYLHISTTEMMKSCVFAQILLSNAQVKMQNAPLDFEDEASWYLWWWDISMQVFHVFCPSCVWKLAWINVQNTQTTVDRSVATCDIHSLAIIPNSLQGLSSSLVTYTCTPCNPYHEGITTHSFNFTFLHFRQHFELEELFIYIYTYM